MAEEDSFDFAFVIRGHLSEGSKPVLVDRIHKIAAASMWIAQDGGVDLDEVNLEEFANLMDRLVMLMRRANASGHKHE